MLVELLPRLYDAAIPGAPEAAQAAREAAVRWLKETAGALPPDVSVAWLKLWEGALPPPDRTLLLRPFLAELYRLHADQLPEGDPDRLAALG
ncbi:MAG: hypothetical protein N3B68_10335, partial [Anaerolineae bacterium]|nr:hypothetical protein [Anaerolineae bacterium]